MILPWAKSATSALVQLIKFPEDLQFATPNVKYVLFSATLALHGEILRSPRRCQPGKISCRRRNREGFLTYRALSISIHHFVVR